MRTIYRRLVLMSVLLLCGYVGSRIYESKPHVTAVEEPHEAAVRTVTITYAKPAPRAETITLPGNITGWYEAPIYARFTGYVKMWHKDYGDQVKKGDILAEINAPDLDAEYAQAKADLETQRARYKLAEVTASAGSRSLPIMPSPSSRSR